MKKLNHIKLFESFNSDISIQIPEQYQIPRGASADSIYLVVVGEDYGAEELIYLVDYENLKKVYNAHNMRRIEGSLVFYLAFKLFPMLYDTKKRLDLEGLFGDDDTDDTDYNIHTGIEIQDTCDINKPNFDVLAMGDYEFYNGGEEIDSYIDTNTPLSEYHPLDQIIKFGGINKCLVVPITDKVREFKALTNGKAIVDSNTIIEDIKGDKKDYFKELVNDSAMTDEEKNYIMKSLIDNYVDISIINEIKEILFNK